MRKGSGYLPFCFICCFGCYLMGCGRVRKVVRDNDFIRVENDLADESIDNDFSDLDIRGIIEEHTF